MILRYFTRFYVISHESWHTAYAVATRLAKLVAAIPGDEISIVAAFSVNLKEQQPSSPPFTIFTVPKCPKLQKCSENL